MVSVDVKHHERSRVRHLEAVSADFAHRRKTGCCLSVVQAVTREAVVCIITEVWGWQAVFKPRFPASFLLQEGCKPMLGVLVVAKIVYNIYTIFGCRLQSELSSCVKVEVAVLGSQSLIVLMASVNAKQYWTWTLVAGQSSGAVWKSRWPSWAPSL